MDRISVMPESLANLIAAGEVVERPASALKELVENSIDAQAKHILVEITLGGLKSIVVKDDGTGMSRDDASLCIERHASSKIKTSYDLMDIRTMGFRGEALPSIGAVSELRIDTSDGVEGTTILVSGGKPPKIQEAPLRQGTTVKVTDLFYNTPARLKYMKSPQLEKAKCVDVMQHIALGFPQVAFDVRADGKLVFSTTGRGDRIEVIQHIWGNDIAKAISRVDKVSYYGYSFECLIAKPEVNYSTKYQMMTFINSRFIYSFKLSRGIEDAYKDYLAPSRYPFACVFIDADPALIDVNVHPSKKEVRISGEESLAVSVRDTIRAALKQQRPIYGDRDTAQMVNQMSQVEPRISAPQISAHPVDQVVSQPVMPDSEFQNILAGTSGIAFQGNDRQETESAIAKARDSLAVPQPEAPVEKPRLPYSDLYPLGQIAKTYIICDSPDGMFIIDQHAAAERINFEKFERRFQESVEEVAPLEPVIMEFPPSTVAAFSPDAVEVLKDMHLRVEPFSPTSLKLVTLPEFLTDKNYQGVLRDIISAAVVGSKDDPLELMRKGVATLACKASIRAGDELSPFEQVSLIRHLAECRNPANCPHGRPTGVRITIHELEKLFRRTGF